MLYVARYADGKLIAYSEDVEMVFNYLKNLYQQPGKERVQVTIEKETNIVVQSELYIHYDEYQLVYFWSSIVVTSWEYCMYDEYFKEYKCNVYDSMIKMAKERLSRLFGYDDIEIGDVMGYLKKTISRDEYLALLDYDRFMKKLGTVKIQNIMNDSGLNYYSYQLNKEYERQINNDN